MTGVVWNEPVWFLWGLFAVTLIGALLPIRVETREDHVILTISVAVDAAILGPRAMLLLWGAVAVAAPLVFAAGVLHRKAAAPASNRVRRALRSAAWVAVSGFACTVGFLIANLVYSGLLGREYPISLATTPDVLIAGVVVTISWVGTMSMRLLSQKAISGTVIEGGLDPFDSVLIPYLLPLLGGFPLITASVAMYHPQDPFPSLFILWWCFPLYAATAFDLHRRRLAQELRREAFARQRLAAIGEVSARIVHQSRHQVGLMGWSIHRLRGLVGRAGDDDTSAVQDELDALAQAKDRLSEMLASELLHEAAGEAPAGLLDGAGSGVGHRGAPTIAEMVDEVTDILQGEADREAVALVVEPTAANGSRPAPRQLRDVVFNLVDNAIDAASSEVLVKIEGSEAGVVTITVCDDGPGLAGTDAGRAFEPFFTTKADGTGMGLAIADALVGDLGGELRYERDGGRTAFIVVLPSASL